MTSFYLRYSCSRHLVGQLCVMPVVCLWNFTSQNIWNNLGYIFRFLHFMSLFVNFQCPYNMATEIYAQINDVTAPQLMQSLRMA